jgi:hypothetical protein
MTYGLVITIASLAVIAYIAAGFVAFAVRSRREANSSESVKTHAGGALFVEGGKTYYTMPSGQRRKVADYPMDLTPGSADMIQFTAVLDKAYAEHMADKDKSRKAAVKAMHEVAREAVRA